MELTKTMRIKLAMFNFIMWFGMAFVNGISFSTVMFIIAACYLAYEVTTHGSK